MFGKKETWKIVYFPMVINNGARGVAFIEAEDRQQAMYIIFLSRFQSFCFFFVYCMLNFA